MFVAYTQLDKKNIPRLSFFRSPRIFDPNITLRRISLTDLTHTENNEILNCGLVCKLIVLPNFLIYLPTHLVDRRIGRTCNLSGCYGEIMKCPDHLRQLWRSPSCTVLQTTIFGRQIEIERRLFQQYRVFCMLQIY